MITENDLLAAGCAIVRSDVTLAQAVAEAIAAERSRVIDVVWERLSERECICRPCLIEATEDEDHPDGGHR